MSDGANIPTFLEATAHGVRIRVKAVPGARRDEISGPLGDRLKIRVSAPPERGKANKAIGALLADALGVRAKDVLLIAGQTSPEKSFEVAGVSPADVANRLSER